MSRSTAMMSRSTASLWIVSVLGALAFASGADAAPSAGDAARGRAVYRVKGCYQCHGVAGQGSIMTGPALATLRLPVDAVRAYVRSPARMMPPYSVKALSDAEVADIVAYLLTLPSPQAASDIPLLRPYTLAR